MKFSDPQNLRNALRTRDEDLMALVKGGCMAAGQAALETGTIQPQAAMQAWLNTLDIVRNRYEEYLAAITATSAAPASAAAPAKGKR